MAARSRPILVWLIVAFNVFGLAVSGLAFVALLRHSVALNESATAYYHSLSPLDWAAASLGLLLTLAATVALFRLDKVAAPVLTVSAVFTALRVAKYVLMNGYAVAVSSMLWPLFGIGLATAICIYAWRLRAQGVLS